MEKLTETLLDSIGSDAQKRLKSLGELKVLEAQDNYFTNILELYVQNSPLQMVAIVILKNGVKKRMNRMELNHIKDTLLRFFQPNVALMKQQAIVIGKIARFDIEHWPNLLPTLQCEKYTFQSLFTLHQAMKQLVTKPMHKKYAYEITPAIFEYLLSLLIHSQINNLLISKTCLKALRQLVLNGFHRFSSSELVFRLFAFLRQWLPQLILSVPASIPWLDDVIKLIGKLLVDCSSSRVVDFILVPSCIELVQYYVIVLAESSAVRSYAIYETIKIQALKILKNVIVHQDYHFREDDRIDLALSSLKSNLLTNDFIVSLARMIISEYLIISNDSMNEWETDPESFYLEEEADHWEYSARSCSEKIIMVLFSTYSPKLCPILIELLCTLPDDCSENGLKLREAVYCSVGLAAHNLCHYFDFGDWFVHRLVSHIHFKQPEWKPIRRRIAKLIGAWVDVKSNKDIRPSMYQVLLELLNPYEDIVVKLTAVDTLRIAVDDFEFVASSFLPYLSSFIDAILQLATSVDEYESKIRCINALIVVIERMAGDVVPSLNRLLEIFPGLWDRSEGQNMFRSSLVSVLGKVVKALRHESYQLYPMIIPILQESLDSSRPGHLYLLEEGLELWLSSVQNCSVASLELIHLIPRGIILLNYSSENLKKVMHILESSIILAPAEILNMFGNAIFSAVGEMLGTLRVEASNCLLRLIDVTIQACVAAKLLPGLFQVMHSNGLFAKLLATILAGEDLGVIIVGFLMIMCRLAVYDANSVLEVVKSGGDIAVAKFLDILAERYDAMGQSNQRRLCAFGFASLVGTGNRLVLDRILPIASILTSVHASNFDFIESDLFSFEPRDGDDEASADSLRRQALKRGDIVSSADAFVPFVKDNFQKAELLVGVAILPMIKEPEISALMSGLLSYASHA